eukprot:CAMPEP_0179464206 /NCGR_PEP_ID=MMETSP0799-20121207/46095_1 /TAXON_ID=46947 /ORGANISM="Geminigera cryophila, Strain CCMP2564" /LENGTH=264 /DNA_ID=CAMNT_0021267903 /DNA_START=152 /DNA_END=946 /DNA_ORIENTATION=+
MAADGGANMAFRRRSSAAGNNTAEQARAALIKAFEGADLDKSGMVTKEELALVIKDQLHIQLTDPINDLDIIFDSLDEDKSGLVSMEEFCRLFEPTIVRRASSSASATMDIDDLMKETFSAILVDAKLERSVVIQGFMRANHEIEKSGKGFGVSFWGSKWRFKIFDGFYTHPKDPATGLLVDVTKRFAHLQQRLNKAQSGEDEWLNSQLETDEDFKKEVKNPTAVAEYCKIWLSVLQERAHEVDESQRARHAASNASNASNCST